MERRTESRANGRDGFADRANGNGSASEILDSAMAASVVAGGGVGGNDFDDVHGPVFVGAHRSGDRTDTALAVSVDVAGGAGLGASCDSEVRAFHGIFRFFVAAVSRDTSFAKERATVALVVGAGGVGDSGGVLGVG